MQHQLQELVVAVEELDVFPQSLEALVLVDLEVEALEQKEIMELLEQLTLEVVAVEQVENQE
jgi:hypothetical protein